MAGKREREWAGHTYEKLEMLKEYLHVFTDLTLRQWHVSGFIDTFAGTTENILKDTGEPFAGSFELALRNEPRFTTIRAIELSKWRCGALRTMAQELGRADVTEVIEGDVNVKIDQALSAFATDMPVLALLDPDGCQLHWNTVVKLAEHKRAAILLWRSLKALIQISLARWTFWCKYRRFA